jgi:Caspase domain/Domain of unknown function (DUF4384)
MRVFGGSWTKFVASLITCFVVLLLVPHAVESQDSPGVKRALLVGINKYKSVPRLQGSLNDIETMRQILITRWGFSDKLITMVTDEAATRNGILAALEQLVKEAGPNDTVYFHYSGHGSQVEDLNGDEPDDHLDETLVPQDGRSGDVRDITDDELDAVFAKMRAKSAMIVLDSCHSGTATRSLDIRTRSIPRDTRIGIYRKAEDAKPRTRAIVPVMTSRYVVMTGAASHQEALDGPIDGRYHGFFTYSLSKSLSQSPPGASPREVFSGVERELKRIQAHFGRSSMPEPQLEAPPHLIEAALLSSQQAAQESGSPSPARLPWLEVQPASDGIVTLVNGTLLGAAPGSTWSLYPPGDTRFAPGRALAVATVTQLNGKDAIGKLQSSAGRIPSGARAIALLPAPSGQRIPIRILDVPADRRGVIEETLRANVKDVDLVGAGQPARFAVDVEGDTLRLLAADGLEVVGSFGLKEPWGAGVATVVSRSSNASELLTLDNPSSQLKVDVRVASAVKSKGSVSNRGIKVVADTQAVKYHIRNQGNPRTQQNSLQLEVRVNADSYVTIVDVDSEGGVNLLFPNSHQNRQYHGDGFMRAGEAVLIPDSLESGNQAGFYWDYSPPKGTDTIRVFSSTDLQTAQMIRDRIASLQAASENASVALKTRAIATGMHSLRQQLISVAARGILTVPDSTSHVPGDSNPFPPETGQSPPGVPANESPTYPVPDAVAPVAFGGATEIAAAPSAPPADWTATSITITISE